MAYLWYVFVPGPIQRNISHLVGLAHPLSKLVQRRESVQNPLRHDVSHGDNADVLKLFLLDRCFVFGLSV